jgi:hypothetical protein
MARDSSEAKGYKLCSGNVIILVRGHVKRFRTLLFTPLVGNHECSNYQICLLPMMNDAIFTYSAQWKPGHYEGTEPHLTASAGYVLLQYRDVGMKSASVRGAAPTTARRSLRRNNTTASTLTLHTVLLPAIVVLDSPHDRQYRKYASSKTNADVQRSSRTRVRCRLAHGVDGAALAKHYASG